MYYLLLFLLSPTSIFFKCSNQTSHLRSQLISLGDVFNFTMYLQWQCWMIMMIMPDRHKSIIELLIGWGKNIQIINNNNSKKSHHFNSTFYINVKICNKYFKITFCTFFWSDTHHVKVDILCWSLFYISLLYNIIDWNMRLLLYGQ